MAARLRATPFRQLPRVAPGNSRMRLFGGKQIVNARRGVVPERIGPPGSRAVRRPTFSFTRKNHSVASALYPSLSATHHPQRARDPHTYPSFGATSHATHLDHPGSRLTHGRADRHTGPAFRSVVEFKASTAVHSTPGRTRRTGGASTAVRGDTWPLLASPYGWRITPLACLAWSHGGRAGPLDGRSLRAGQAPRQPSQLQATREPGSAPRPAGRSTRTLPASRC